MEIKLSIKGMTCQMCVKHVQEGLQAVEGVQNVNVDLDKETAVVRGEEIDAQKLIAAVEEEGYEATPA